MWNNRLDIDGKGGKTPASGGGDLCGAEASKAEGLEGLGPDMDKRGMIWW